MAGISTDQNEAERTACAMRAFDFSMLFNARFAKSPVGGDAMRVPTVIEPEGMSTGKGAAARQPIVLLPPGEKVGITVGWVDTAQDKAHLKTYDYLLQRHHARHPNLKFGVAESGYNAFFSEAMKYMHEHRIICSTDQEYGGTRPTITRKSGLKPRSNPMVVAVAAIAAVGLAGLLFYFFLMPK